MPDLLLKLTLLLALLAGTSISQATTCDTPKTLRFALWMPKNTPSGQNYNQPVVTHLEQQLGLEIELLPMASIDALVNKLHREQLDIAFIGAKAYINAHKKNPRIKAFATFAEQSNPDVIQHYRSVLISLKGNQRDTIESLRGHPVALVSPGSISGYIAPKALFSQQVQSPINTFFSQLIFSGQHHKSVIAVLKGNVDAAFVASRAVELMSEEMGIDRQQFNILWQSPLIPHAPFVARTSLCQPLRERIQAAFLSIDKNPSNQEWLDLFLAARVIAVGDKDYDVVRTMYATP